MTSRWNKALAALLVAASVLTGCATIPSSSGVHQGPDIQNLLSNDYLYYSPSGPLKGQSQADILAGFLNASTGPQNDYGVARQYLAPSFRTTWSPNQLVYIQRGGQKTTLGTDGVATVSIGVSAVVDSLGHYSNRAPGSSVKLHFKMIQVNGQWRISEAPNAVVMIRPVFEVIFHSYEVYFFDHSYSYLIPDLRWFPARASTATRLVAAMLAGPSPVIKGAVAPILPANTSLAIDSVTVDKTTAVVNLTPQALQASRLAKQRFKAQLTATLTQLRGVSSVEIQIDSAIQKISDFVPASTSSGAFAPVVLSANSLQQLIGPSGSRLANAQTWIKLFGVRDFAVTSDETSIALVGKAGVYTARLDQPETPPLLVDTRKNLISPRYDRRGQLWLIGTDGKVQIVPQTGKSVWITVPWLAKHVLKAVALSPEGARMAAVVADADGTLRLMVSSVNRNQLGIVTGFGAPVELSYGVGKPNAIEWSGTSGILVLADVSGVQSNLTLLTIGGDPREVGTLDHAVDLMVSDDGTNIYVLDDQNRLMQYRGYTWSQLDQQVTAAHMVN
ncbi:MAG: GerMN domain-containing protein [Actinomycetales bacterium]|nr:GerMN domain-containing protein [Actinomycetales bacterium]